MFEKRLRWFVILMVAVALVTIARLVDIQVVRADHFEALADEILTRPVRYLAAPRGSILDRNGRVLVSDEPTSDVSLRYEILAALRGDPSAAPSGAELPAASRKYLAAVARMLRKRGRFPADMPTSEIVSRLEDRVDGLWGRLTDLTGVPREEMVRRAEQIRWRVGRMKAYVERNNPTQKGKPIREEEQFHTLISGADEDVTLAVRIELEPEHPWLRVVPSSRRVAHDADALVHVLGRLGAADSGSIESDPFRDDELRRLWPGAYCGISGVERVAELTLRGARGRVVENFDRTEIEEYVDRERGRDVTLTIDSELQREVLTILQRAVGESENPAGGSAVVLDIATRELLALVSYPVYAYDDYRTDYARLAQDNRRQPLRFRAVANIYPPGSTCKVIALYGGLEEGVVGADDPIVCSGYFRPNNPDQFRCWIYNQYRVTHGAQDAEDAIRNSCNIFFYTVGDRLGVDRLCKWFSEFGLGRPQGTGLIEESPGIVPTAQWIAQERANDPHVRRADAWNYAIGQGEVSATPLQAANVAATVGSGRWEPVKLVRDETGTFIGRQSGEAIEFDERYLRVLRTGMWRVVNERGATAFAARLATGEQVMCGKTGSAQASRRVISKQYTVRWPDGRTEEVIATSRRAALARFSGAKPRVIADRIYELFPPRETDGELPSHAWFIGYTQSRETPPGDAPRGRSYALSVIVEYGGSGGKVAGPVAKAIAERLVGGESELKTTN